MRNTSMTGARQSNTLTPAENAERKAKRTASTIRWGLVALKAMDSAVAESAEPVGLSRDTGLRLMSFAFASPSEDLRGELREFALGLTNPEYQTLLAVATACGVRPDFAEVVALFRPVSFIEGRLKD